MSALKPAQLVALCSLSAILLGALAPPVFGVHMADLLQAMLGAAGVPDNEADRVAAAAAVDPTAATNPVPLDETNLKTLFLDCVRGNL